MKAIVFTRYGSPDGLELRELEMPVPKDNQIRVRVYATSVTAGDCEIRSMKFPLWLQIFLRFLIGPLQPKRNMVLGTELAGEVESVGKAITQFKEGDAVFGSAGLTFGTNAEYKCVPEKESVAIKPTNMSYEEAVTVPFGGRDALHFLRKANVQPGQKVLVIGAGGSIGTYGVQLAKYFGAEVTGVDSGDKLDMLRSIGADHVIDYTREDFTRNGVIYDVIFDAVGKSPFPQTLNSVSEKGYYLLANPKTSQLFRAPWLSRKNGKKIVIQAANGTVEDLKFLTGLIEAGKLKAVIDKVYPLEQTADAHRYVDTGRKKGNVVVSISHLPQT